MTESPQQEPPQGGSLTRRSLAGSLGVLLSRLSGILRSMVLSASFGAGLALDAFFVGLRLPSSLRDLLADGALSSAATTVLTAYDLQDQEERQSFRRVLAQILMAFLVVTVGLAALGAAFAESIVSAMVSPDFPAQGVAFATTALGIMAFYLPLAMWSALCMAVLAIHGALLRATVASSFFNVGICLAALAFTLLGNKDIEFAVVLLAWGTMAGGVVQCVYLSWPLLRSGDLSFGVLGAAVFGQHAFWKSREVGRVGALLLPRTVGHGAVVLGMVASTFYATSLGPGGLTYVTNALIIIMVPVGLFGVAGGYAALPLLSRAWQERRIEDFWRLLGEGMWLVTFLSAASVTGLVVAADVLLVLIFEHGSFDRADVLANATVVTAMAGSIVFSSQSKIQTQALFALGHTGFVAMTSFLYLAVLVLLYELLVPSMGLAGMGLAAVLASMASWLVNGAKLWRLSCLALGHRQTWWRWQQGVLVVVAVSVAAIGVFAPGTLQPHLPESSASYGTLEAFFGLMGRGVAVVLVWGILAFVLAPPAWRRRLQRAVGRFPVVRPPIG
jgi:putative peptidoglycan lipid II flippase